MEGLNDPRGAVMRSGSLHHFATHATDETHVIETSQGEILFRKIRVDKYKY
jgi:hypothetical protein